MSLAPLLSAPAAVQVHAIAALLSLGLGTFQLLLAKGTAAHRSAGWLWVAAMAATALSALAVASRSPWFATFGPIHLLVPVVLLSLVFAVRAARAGRIGRHRRIMLQTFWLALVVTGLFTLWPGRIMYQVLVG
jgi:uncharacterized membrane protein